jgi:hypothetical protein
MTAEYGKFYLHRVKLWKTLRKTIAQLLNSKEYALPSFQGPEIRRYIYP